MGRHSQPALTTAHLHTQHPPNRIPRQCPHLVNSVLQVLCTHAPLHPGHPCTQDTHAHRAPMRTWSTAYCRSSAVTSPSDRRRSPDGKRASGGLPGRQCRQGQCKQRGRIGQAWAWDADRGCWLSKTGCGRWLQSRQGTQVRGQAGALTAPSPSLLPAAAAALSAASAAAARWVAAGPPA